MTSSTRSPLARLRPGALVRVGLALATLGLVLWRVDVLGALSRLGTVELRWALAGLVMFTLSKVVHAYRWRRLLLDREQLTTRRLAPVFLLSNMANSLVPFRAGDLLRVELPSRRFGVPRAELASTVFVVESVFDGVAFVVLLGAALLLVDLPEAARTPVSIAVGLALGLFAASVVAARAGLEGEAMRTRWLRFLPRAVRGRLERWVPEFVAGMRSLRGNRQLLEALAISVGAWLLEVPLYWMMAQAFGLEPSVGDALVLMIAANLIVSVPLTPWDVGPYEIVVTETYVLLGADRVEASTFAIGSHLLLQLWIGLTGLVAMWDLDLRPRDVFQRRGDRGT